MKITDAQVEYVAALAKLSLDEEQKKRLTKEMESIIAFADKLSELDTEGVIPSAHSIAVENVFREDEIKPSYDREDILLNAPTQNSGCFSVPKVVE